MKALLSDERFSVDSTLIGEPSRRHRFEPDGERGQREKLLPQEPAPAKTGDGGGEPPGPGRNDERDFHGEKRSNDTRDFVAAMRHRGTARVGWMFTFTAAAYNLVRLPRLLTAA